MPTSHTTNPLILILIIFSGLLGGYIYYSQIATAVPPEIPPATVSGSDSLGRFKDITFPQGRLELPSYRELRIYGEAPVQPGVSGRADIFAPF